jgi:hypothetical protein
MSTDHDQLLGERFARLAPQADPADWLDVLRRARRPAPRRALLVAALVAGAFVLAGAALALSGVVGTGVPAIDRLLDRSSDSFLNVPPGSPVPDFRPQPGSVGEPLRFRFRGLHYTAVGFRARDGSICSARVDPRARRSGGVGCAGARLLRRALAREPLFLSGGGGGPQLIAHGFARADVESLRLAGAGDSGVVALSEPWRPRGHDTEPIRFFYVVVVSHETGPRSPLLPEGVRIQARLADGSVSELRR